MNSAYRRLCAATAEHLFDPEKAGIPVYTLPEEDALQRIAESAGLDARHAQAEFCRTVRDTLFLDQQGTSPLRWHMEATSLYLSRKLQLAVPPSLPLLVILTLAAEAMHADANMAANNFYGRLRPMLAVPAEREHLLISAYQKNADLLWRSLNLWLEAWEGERGVPTAYSLGQMRHIGLPMSQAVVRKHDRVGLIQVFEFEGLPPGFRMSADDMEFTLDPYATSEPSPLSRNICRLWANADARARIVQAACLELESWTGAAERESRSRSSSQSARLIAYLRTFPRMRIEFNLAIQAREQNAGEVLFKSSRGEVTLPAIAGSPGVLRLASADAVSSDSIVGEALQGWVVGDQEDCFSRRPRRVVPLRWDEVQGCFIEVERVSLGEDNLVLTTSDAQSRVGQLLEMCARPGWNLVEGVPGLPTGWALFERVQILAAPNATIHVDLTPLVPRSQTSLTMRGGFDLPGRLRKWSSLQPPEIIAHAVGAENLSVRLYKGDRPSEETERLSVQAAGELAVLTLADYELPDGEYFASMFIDSEKKPRAGSVVRLRSADTPLFRVEEADMHLVYSPASGSAWPLSAGPANWSDFVNGARIVGGPAAVDTARAMSEFTPRERQHRPAGQRKSIHVGDEFAQDSCMVTGRHRLLFPPDMGGRPKSATIEGECSTCGLVKRGAATAWAARRRGRNAQLANRLPVVLPPIRQSGGPDLRVLFDAICHTGQGSYGDFERIASHIEGSSLFADTFLRANEILGHIDVSRDEYLQVTNWAVNAPTLVPIRDHKWVLVGSHSKGLLQVLRGYFGGQNVTESHDQGSLRVTLDAPAGVVTENRDALNALEIQVRETSPALHIARSLPAISQIECGLKRIAIPSYRSVEKWDTVSASWFSTDSLASVGAYRIKDFRSLYVVRSEDDLDSGMAGVGNAQLVKHIANAWAHDPLVGYHTQTESVVTPLGADLPGLYGRALALCSGITPQEHLKGRLVQYPTVPRAVADVIFDRLTR